MRQLQTESIAELAPDLVKAIGSLKNSKKTTAAYKYKYAELGSMIEESREILMAHNIFITSFSDIDDKGDEILITQVTHKSGEWIRSYNKIDLKLTIELMKESGNVDLSKINIEQIRGSSKTYNRRQAYAAILNIAQEDDDAQSNTNQSAKPKAGVVRTNTKQVNNSTASASPAQIGFLKTLLTEKGFTIQNYLEQKVLSSESEITSSMASESINKMKS
jgi:hypothetical protein